MQLLTSPGSFRSIIAVITPYQNSKKRRFPRVDSVRFCYRRLIGSSFRGHILDLVSHRGIVNGQNGSVEYYLGADTVSLKSPTQTTIDHLAKTFSGNNLKKRPLSPASSIGFFGLDWQRYLSRSGESTQAPIHNLRRPVQPYVAQENYLDPVVHSGVQS